MNKFIINRTDKACLMKEMTNDRGSSLCWGIGRTIWGWQYFSWGNKELAGGTPPKSSHPLKGKLSAKALRLCSMKRMTQITLRSTAEGVHVACEKRDTEPLLRQDTAPQRDIGTCGMTAQTPNSLSVCWHYRWPLLSFFHYLILLMCKWTCYFYLKQKTKCPTLEVKKSSSTDSPQ